MAATEQEKELNPLSIHYKPQEKCDINQSISLNRIHAHLKDERLLIDYDHKLVDGYIHDLLKYGIVIPTQVINAIWNYYPKSLPRPTAKIDNVARRVVSTKFVSRSANPMISYKAPDLPSNQTGDPDPKSKIPCCCVIL